jgi:hypothetical protein
MLKTGLDARGKCEIMILSPAKSDKDFFLDILSDKWYNAFRLGEGLEIHRMYFS